MFKKLFSIKYHSQLIKNLAEALPTAVLASGVVAPLIIAYVLHGFVPQAHINIWLFLHVIVFFIRFFAAKKLLNLLKTKSKKTTNCLKINLILISLTAMLYGVVIFQSVIYNIPELNIFMIASIMIALAAASLSTLSAVIHAFMLFFLLMIIPLIAAMFYHGGEMFMLFGFVLSIFLIVHALSGYKHYIILRNAISLEETFETIFDKSTDGIMLFQGTRFKECNESIVKMFKYPSKEAMVNSHISSFIPRLQPDGTSSIKKMLLLLHMALRHGTSSFEWLHKKADGEEFWCEIVLTKVYLENEELIHGVWRDISDRKRLEEKQLYSLKEIENLNKNLEQTVKDEVFKNREKDKQLFTQSRLAQMGEMLAMIAHQWRQPLAAIASASASLNLKAKLGKLDDKTVMKKTDDIAQYTQYLSQTVNDFREFFKPNKELKMTTLNELVEGVLRIAKSSIESHNITLLKELNSQSSFISYPNELKQVILNFVKNAEDILLENHIVHPYIKIVTYDENGTVVLKVYDNGGGISNEIIDKIFDPYFSTKTKKDGTGLGLYISKTIVEEHCEGILRVSNGDDGAIFEMVLSHT